MFILLKLAMTSVIQLLWYVEEKVGIPKFLSPPPPLFYDRSLIVYEKGSFQN